MRITSVSAATWYSTSWRIGLLCYLATTLVWAIGALVGNYCLDTLDSDIQPLSSTPLARLNRFDAIWYQRIATQGYYYDPQQRSNVAFFPAYPVLISLVHSATGTTPAFAALAISHAALLALFMLIGKYVSVRMSTESPHLVLFTLLALGLFPTACFFRVAYTESLFTLVAVAALYTIQERRIPLVYAAILVGLETAVRPVGVALVPALLWEALSRGDWTPRAWRNAAGFAVLGCWGLLAYMLFQAYFFGSPLVFVQAQDNWEFCPRVAWSEKMVILASLEPIWGVYVPDQPEYWRNHGPQLPFYLSLQFANPILFTLACVLVYIGAWKRWLTVPELLFSAGCLAIPYVTRSYEMAMASQGRFAMVAFPIFIVLAQLFSRAPKLITAIALVIAGLYMAVYGALFVSGQMVI